MDDVKLIEVIAEIGSKNKSEPYIKDVEIFRHFFDKDFNLITNELNSLDGNCTRRELITRFLLLNAVLDQGPDTEGVRQLLCDTINYLYRHEIRILHTPLDFFKELGIIITEIDNVHDIVKKLRAKKWARNNNSTALKYNLFMDNTTQTLNYAVFRWGVPLSVPLILENDYKSKDDDINPELLLDYLEDDNDAEWPSSAEIMSKKIKQHKRYGLGKAIGDKAAHLFAKWIVHTFNLTRKRDITWGKYSFEVPFDSNAGRVLFRTGYLLNWADIDDYKKSNVIQPNQGKGGTDYIRVTNIRGMKATKNISTIDPNIYRDLCVKYLLTHRRAPKKYEIQKIPIAQLLKEKKYGPGDLDDGLMYIGTHFCFNIENPNCDDCPINSYCSGFNENILITKYRT